MVSVLTLHNEVRTSLNRLNSGWDQAITAIDIDSRLNKAIHYIQENYVALAERSKVFENHLRELEIPEFSLNLQNNEEKNYTVGELPSDYYNYLSIYAIARKGSCEDRIRKNIYFQRDDDSLSNPNWKPSWEWRTGLYNISSPGVLYYHNKEYEVVDLIMTYIKKIPEVAAYTLMKEEGQQYVKADGTVITKNHDLDLTSSVLWRKICAMAVFYIRMDMDSNYKASIDEIMFNENTSVDPNK